MKGINQFIIYIKAVDFKYCLITDSSSIGVIEKNKYFSLKM